MIFHQTGVIASESRFENPDISAMSVDHWFDGADRSVFSPNANAGTKISEWRDKSQFARHLYQSDPWTQNKMAIDARTLRTCVYCQGMMEGTPTISTEFMFAVAFNVDAAGARTIFYNGEEGVNGFGLKTVIIPLEGVKTQLQVGGITITGERPIVGVNVFSGYGIGGEIKLFRNGIEVGSASGSVTQALTGSFKIGDTENNIYEFIDVGHNIGSRLGDIVQYMIWKWAAYPYKRQSGRDSLSSTIAFNYGNYIDGIVTEAGPTEAIASSVSVHFMSYNDNTIVIGLIPTEQIGSSVAAVTVLYINGTVTADAPETEQLASAVSAVSVGYIDGIVSETADEEQFSSTISANTLTYS